MTDFQPLSIEEIKTFLPHRYPFLLIDRVTDYQGGEFPTLTAIKCVTHNEPFFQGHFPEHPVMPGVLIIEAMAQAAGVLANLEEHTSGCGKIIYMAKIDKAKFTRLVVPGDQLVLKATQKRVKMGMGCYSCEAFVDGKKAASAEIVCAEKRG